MTNNDYRNIPYYTNYETGSGVRAFKIKAAHYVTRELVPWDPDDLGMPEKITFDQKTLDEYPKELVAGDYYVIEDAVGVPIARIPEIERHPFRFSFCEKDKFEREYFKTPKSVTWSSDASGEPIIQNAPEEYEFTPDPTPGVFTEASPGVIDTFVRRQKEEYVSAQNEHPVKDRAERLREAYQFFEAMSDIEEKKAILSYLCSIYGVPIGKEK